MCSSSMQAATWLRVITKRILREYGYPPDKQARATDLLLEQAEVLCRDWSGASS
jgi:type I restriction enzyme R subunit